MTCRPAQRTLSSGPGPAPLTEVEAAGDARNDLVARTIEGADETTRDPIQHAVAMFGKRGVTTEEKRSACVTLAGVLELHRQLLQGRLYSRDEVALFQIANQFDLPHRSASQRGTTIRCSWTGCSGGT